MYLLTVQQSNPGILEHCSYNINVDEKLPCHIIFFVAVFGVSFVRCERCNFTENHGTNTNDEFGAAIGIYLVNQFGSKEAVPRNEFNDWYAIVNNCVSVSICYMVTSIKMILTTS